MFKCTGSNTYDFGDFSGQYLFTTTIKCDPTGQLYAKYSIKVQPRLFHKEKIGSIDLKCKDYSDYDLELKVDAIVEKHLSHVRKTVIEMTHELQQPVSKFRERLLGVEIYKYRSKERKTLKDYDIELLMSIVHKFCKNTPIENIKIEIQKYLPLKNFDYASLSSVVHKYCTTSLLPESIDIGSFTECRRKAQTAIEQFTGTLKSKKLCNVNLESHINLDSLEWAPYTRYAVSEMDENGITIDHEWPLEASLARLLLHNPRSGTPYPHLGELVELFIKVRERRLEFIKNTTMDYVLYYEGELVFEQIDSERRYYKAALFRELCQPLHNADIWEKAVTSLGKVYGYDEAGRWAGRLPKPIQYFRIDENFIKNAIEKRHVPEMTEKMIESKLNIKEKEFVKKSSREVLSDFKGLTITEALDKSEIYGNKKKRKEINKTEIKPLSTLDKYLFDIISSICEGDTSYSSSSAEWNDLKHLYPYLADGLVFDHIVPKKHKYVVGLADDGWRKLKVVHIYLCGEIDLAHIGLNENNALQVLRIAIMFDLAISWHNFIRPKHKLVLKRGTGELRTLILKKMNYLESFNTFTRTLNLNKFYDTSYKLNSKNWTIDRSAIQGKISSNILILALFASKVLEKEAKEEVKLHGSKGGSGSGKSISNRERIGVLNADYAKWLLRWKTEIENQKVQFEGSKVIFSLCFEKIASGLIYLGKREKLLYYTVDMRMTKLENVMTYLVNPAIKRNCNVSLKDFDVPLLTSINRMFKRTPTGREPLQELKIIEDGFKETRGNRKEIIEYIKQCDRIQEYELYFMGKLVAQKKEGEFKIIHEKEYDICLNYPKKELERCLNLPINDQYIQEALARGDFLPEEAIIVTQIFTELKEKICVQYIQEALKRGDILPEEVIFATQMFTELKEKITVREAYEAHLNS